MNDLLISQELAAVLADPEYSALAALLTPAGGTPQIYAAQASADLVRPSLSITGDWQPYGPRRKGTLTLELRGRVGDETADQEHQARFSALYTALLANPAALKAALALRGHVLLLAYGPAAEQTIEAKVEGDDLVTVFRLVMAWSFV